MSVVTRADEVSVKTLIDGYAIVSKSFLGLDMMEIKATKLPKFAMAMTDTNIIQALRERVPELQNTEDHHFYTFPLDSHYTNGVQVLLVTKDVCEDGINTFRERYINLMLSAARSMSAYSYTQMYSPILQSHAGDEALLRVPTREWEVFSDKLDVAIREMDNTSRYYYYLRDTNFKGLPDNVLKSTMSQIGEKPEDIVLIQFKLEFEIASAEEDDLVAVYHRVDELESLTTTQDLGNTQKYTIMDHDSKSYGYLNRLPNCTLNSSIMDYEAYNACMCQVSLINECIFTTHFLLGGGDCFIKDDFIENTKESVDRSLREVEAFLQRLQYGTILTVSMIVSARDMDNVKFQMNAIEADFIPFCLKNKLLYVSTPEELETRRNRITTLSRQLKALIEQSKDEKSTGLLEVSVAKPFTKSLMNFAMKLESELWAAVCGEETAVPRRPDSFTGSHVPRLTCDDVITNLGNPMTLFKEDVIELYKIMGAMLSTNGLIQLPSPKYDECIFLIDGMTRDESALITRKWFHFMFFVVKRAYDLDGMLSPRKHDLKADPLEYFRLEKFNEFKTSDFPPLSERWVYVYKIYKEIFARQSAWIQLYLNFFFTNADQEHPQIRRSLYQLLYKSGIQIFPRFILADPSCEEATEWCPIVRFNDIFDLQ